MTLIPSIPDLQKLIEKSGTSLAEVLDRLAKAQAEREKTEHEPPKHRPLPDLVPIDKKQRTILRSIAKKIDEFVFPTKARVLTEDEKTQAITLFEEIKAAKSALTLAETTFRETFHLHLDVELEKAKLADGLEQDKALHYVAEGEVTADGLSNKVTRELRGGNAEALTLADLEKLEVEDLIDHATFLGLTSEVPRHRVVDEGKIMQALAKQPELLSALATVVRLSPQSTAMYVRKVK